jgi:shikimate kinase
MVIGVDNIALVGFRACGKTTIGRILAARRGWSFVDMDEELVTRFGAEIQAWVLEHGWESFRDAESQLLAELATHTRQVVATGGGVILRADNRELLHRHFLVVWLQASVENIQARLAQDPKTASQRPPLTDLPLRDEIRHLLEQRTPHYDATAHLALATDGQDAESLADTILHHLP